MHRASRTILFALAVLALPAMAVAQDAAGRIELDAGAAWRGGLSLGQRDALETANAGGTYRLFSSATEIGSSAGVEARLGVGLSSRIDLEAFASYARPVLRTALSGDVEGATSVTASETVEQIVVGGGAVIALRARNGRRLVPFAAVNAGMLRELHQGQTLVATGKTVDAGAGVKMFLRLRPSAAVKAAGLRLDVRATARTGGVAFDDAWHVSPSASASLFVRF